MRQFPFAPILVLGVALLAFGPALGGGFVYDDHAYLLENAAVTADEAIHTAPLGEPIQGLWRPLTVLSWRLQWDGPGTRPGPFHALDLALHALASLLLLFLGRSLGLSRVGACLGAVLFACHPSHAEAVAWITARSELLATVFVLAAWLAHRRPGPLAALGAPLALVLACLSKENALAAPALFILADLGLRRRPLPWGRWGALALAVTLVVITRWTLLESPLPAHGPYRDLAFGERLPVALRVLAHGLRLLAWPTGLRVEYDRDEFLGQLELSLPALIGALGFAALLLRSGGRRSALLLALVPVALLPVLHLVPIGEPFAERFLYLPSALFCLALGSTLAALARREERASGVGASLLLTTVLVVASVFAARSAVRPFRSDLELWANAASQAPQVPIARYNHGVFLDEAGQFAALAPDEPGAADELRTSLELDPEHAFAGLAHQLLARHALGQSGFGLPDAEAAARHDRQALRLFPALVEPRLRLAEIALSTPQVVTRGEATAVLLPLLPADAASALTPEQAAAVGALFAQLASGEAGTSSTPSTPEDAPAPAGMVPTGTSSVEGS